MKGNNKIRKRGKEIRSLLLFSGGLDSILAAEILKKQNMDVTALAFESYFFDAGQAEKSARENNIKLITKNISRNHFGIVKNPRYGYGAGMNPCADCHLLMVREAKKIMRQENYDILATGEVLGQRPISQNLEALKLIEKKAGLSGKILRPLSAKALPETKYERRKLVQREKLYDFSGRSRKEQIGLAKKFKIKRYPSPAGGCILTDKEYSKKLRELLEKVEKIRESDLKLLRFGRHFWSGDTRIILGRNHEENLKLRRLAEKGDILAELSDVPGPLALIRGPEKSKAKRKTKELVVRYAKKKSGKSAKFNFLKK